MENNILIILHLKNLSKKNVSILDVNFPIHYKNMAIILAILIHFEFYMFDE